MAAQNSRDTIPTSYYINNVVQLPFAMIKECDNHCCMVIFLFFFFQFRCVKKQQELISKMYRLKSSETDKTR